MENLLAHSHNILVHFALALFTTGFVVEVIGLVLQHKKTQYAGALMIVAGGIAGFLTMYTGEFAEENVEDVLATGGEQALEIHEEWGGWAGYALLLTALVRLTVFWVDHQILYTGYLLLGGASLVLLLITAHYGGKVTHAGHPHTAITSFSLPAPGTTNYESDSNE